MTRNLNCENKIDSTWKLLILWHRKIYKPDIFWKIIEVCWLLIHYYLSVSFDLYNWIASIFVTNPLLWVAKHATWNINAKQLEASLRWSRYEKYLKETEEKNLLTERKEHAEHFDVSN